MNVPDKTAFVSNGDLALAAFGVPPLIGRLYSTIQFSEYSVSDGTVFTIRDSVVLFTWMCPAP
ncbi:hypothetical protein D3C74_415070 [compost metagenome]